MVNNHAIQDPANIPHFFRTPQLYADQPELAQYRPLTLVSFTLDALIVKPLNSKLFDVESFLWFVLELALFAGLCSLIPGAGKGTVFLAVAVFAVHPVTGETLNYSSHRGDIFGAIALLAGLAWRIAWPDRMPREIMHWKGVPKTGMDDFRRHWSPLVNAFYRGAIEAPLGLYLIPIVLGLFADPDIAVFPLLLLAYILIFDRKPNSATWRRVLPSALVCGGFWVAQLVYTWKYAAGFRKPSLGYWITQPWVIVRYLGTFLAPVHLTAGSDLPVFASLWSPLALAGFAGLAGLIVVAVMLGRRPMWRTVSFGLWWFLITLLPSCLVPQRLVEANSRMYIPLLGLAIATSQAAWILYELLYRRGNEFLQTRRQDAASNGLALNLAAIALAALTLLTLARLTYLRTEVWSTPRDFWEDVTKNSPHNGSAFIDLGAAMNTLGQTDRGWADLQHAVSLISADAPDQIRVARAFDGANQDIDAETHFRLATQADPGYAPGWSAYGRWLMDHLRLKEGFEAATQALKLRPWSTDARHILMDYYSAISDWANLRKTAEETLLLDPTDRDAHRSLSVAQAGVDRIRIAEEKAKADPSVDDFLALSVQYYRNRRFEDSIDACNKALKVRPELPEAYSNIAAAYYALGKTDQAMTALKECLRIRPDFALAKKNLDFLISLKNDSQPAAAR